MIILLTLTVLTLSVAIYFRQPMFGRRPSGERLEKILQSPHYKNGSFQNLHNTPSLTEGASYYGVLKEFLLTRHKRRKPAGILPSGKKVDLLALPGEEEVLVWFGHSSYFLQTGGKRFLVDPVLSGAASPIRSTTLSFKGSDLYAPEEIPAIDYLLITHDHWDHLDFRTIMALKPRIKKVITGLGTGQHFEHWGFDSSLVIEKDWYEEVALENGFKLNFMPARHFSGRSLKRNTALWVSFVLTTPVSKIFIGGDSGYDSHFADIGQRFGPFDLAILECGQYDKSWRYIHMLPEEIVQAAMDLGAKKLMPVHWGKFSLANHPWDDPILQVSINARKANMPLVTPMIGEAVDLSNLGEFKAWWEGVE